MAIGQKMVICHAGRVNAALRQGNGRAAQGATGGRAVLTLRWTLGFTVLYIVHGLFHRLFSPTPPVWRPRSSRLLKGKVYVANDSRHNARGRITAGHCQYCASAGRRTCWFHRGMQGRQLLIQCHEKGSLSRSQGSEGLVQPVTRRCHQRGRARGCPGTRGGDTGSSTGSGAGKDVGQGARNTFRYGGAGWRPGTGMGQQEQQGVSLLLGPLVRQNQERRLYV